MVIIDLLCLPRCLNQDVHMKLDLQFKEDDLRRDHSAKIEGMSPNSG